MWGRGVVWAGTTEKEGSVEGLGEEKCREVRNRLVAFL